MKFWWRPDYYLSSVTDITRDFLRERSVTGLCLDVDCTITDYKDGDIPPEIRKWLGTLRLEGIGLCLVSNGGGRRIKRIAETLELPFIAQAMKPLPIGIKRAVRMLRLPPNCVAMVGDQIFADVWAGNWAGVKTILVCPRGPASEPFVTRWKRPFERWLLKKYQLSPESLK